MGTPKEYVDFLAKKSRDNPCDRRPFEFSVWPSWLGPTPEPCVVYMSFSDCVRALEMRCQMAPTSKKEEAEEEQIAFLTDNMDEEGAEFFLFTTVMGEKPKATRRTYAPTTQEHTLFSRDGRTARGTKKELVALTGLTSRRVADLVGGSRSYANGWATTPARAFEGPRKPGRPRKV